MFAASFWAEEEREGLLCTVTVEDVSILEYNFSMVSSLYAAAGKQSLDGTFWPNDDTTL